MKLLVIPWLAAIGAMAQSAAPALPKIKYVPYDNVQVIAVGDGAKIRESLKKFGPVEERTIE